MRPEMKKMIDRIMIIRSMFGLTLLLKSKLVSDLRGISGGGGDDREMKFCDDLISGKIMFCRENFVSEKEIKMWKNYQNSSFNLFQIIISEKKKTKTEFMIACSDF